MGSEYVFERRVVFPEESIGYDGCVLDGGGGAGFGFFLECHGEKEFFGWVLEFVFEGGG